MNVLKNKFALSLLLFSIESIATDRVVGAEYAEYSPPNIITMTLACGAADASAKFCFGAVKKKWSNGATSYGSVLCSAPNGKCPSAFACHQEPYDSVGKSVGGKLQVEQAEIDRSLVSGRRSSAPTINASTGISATPMHRSTE